MGARARSDTPPPGAARTAVKDAKVATAISIAHMDDVCILHPDAPPVHLGKPDAKVFGSVALEHGGADWLWQ